MSNPEETVAKSLAALSDEDVERLLDDAVEAGVNAACLSVREKIGQQRADAAGITAIGPRPGLSTETLRAALLSAAGPDEDVERPLDDAVHDAVNAACLLIQEKIGQQYGDVAGVAFSGPQQDLSRAEFREALRNYLDLERTFSRP